MARATLVVLHGHGDHPDRLRDHLRSLPPVAAGHLDLVVPASTHGPEHAPHWFDHDDVGAPHHGQLRASLDQLDQLAGTWTDPRPVIVLGSSQGAALALSWLLSRDRPAALAGVVALAGFLPPGELGGELGVDPDRAAGLPLLFVHGEDDEVVPPPLSRSVARLLERHGAVVSWHAVPGGHELDEAMLATVAGWLDTRLATRFDVGCDDDAEPPAPA